MTQGNFGRPLGRFGVHNPIATPGRTIGGSNIWLATQLVPVAAGFTTTNTTDILYAYSGTITTIGADRVAFHMWGDASLKHSAGAGASVDVGMFLDYGVSTGTGEYWSYFGGLFIPSDTLYTHFPLYNAFNLKSTTNAYTFVPGLHTIGYVVKNNTVGTLTMENNAWSAITTLEIPWKVLA